MIFKISRQLLAQKINKSLCDNVEVNYEPYKNMSIKEISSLWYQSARRNGIKSWTWNENRAERATNKLYS